MPVVDKFLDFFGGAIVCPIGEAEDGTVSTFAEFFGLVTVPASQGQVKNNLSVDYEDDWEWIDGIEDVGFRFGPQRTHRGATPDAPTSGVKVFRCNPTQKELMMAAANGSIESSDMVFVCWASTLMDGCMSIEPKIGDFFVADRDWRIIQVKRTSDYAQWRCMVRESVK